MKPFRMNDKNRQAQEGIGREQLDTRPIPGRSILRNKQALRFRIILAIIVIALTWFVMSVISSRLAWKIVVLDNGQAYFGRFIDIPLISNITLHNAHYMKSDDTKLDDKGKPTINIFSVTDDVHSPRDIMAINKAHIVYYQRLQPNTILYNGLTQTLEN